MKKAIILLSILLLALTAFCIFEGKQYIDTIKKLTIISEEKSTLIDKQLDLNKQLNDLKNQFDNDSLSLLESDTGCKLWKNLDEALKETTE